MKRRTAKKILKNEKETPGRLKYHVGMLEKAARSVGQPIQSHRVSDKRVSDPNQSERVTPMTNVDTLNDSPGDYGKSTMGSFGKSKPEKIPQKRLVIVPGLVKLYVCAHGRTATEEDFKVACEQPELKPTMDLLLSKGEVPVQTGSLRGMLATAGFEGLMELRKQYPGMIVEGVLLAECSPTMMVYVVREAQLHLPLKPTLH